MRGEQESVLTPPPPGSGHEPSCSHTWLCGLPKAHSESAWEPQCEPAPEPVKFLGKPAEVQAAVVVRRLWRTGQRGCGQATGRSSEQRSPTAHSVLLELDLRTRSRGLEVDVDDGVQAAGQSSGRRVTSQARRSHRQSREQVSAGVAFLKSCLANAEKKCELKAQSRTSRKASERTAPRPSLAHVLLRVVVMSAGDGTIFQADLVIKHF